MVSNQYTNFHKNSCTHLLESCPQTGDRQTNTQTDGDRWTDGWTNRRTDRQTERQTDRQGEKNIPQTSFAGVLIG